MASALCASSGTAWLPHKKSSSTMPIEPSRVLGLRGTDGQVSLGEEAQFAGFLRDAAMWFDHGHLSFPVPFSAAALELLAECCRAAHRAFLQRSAMEVDHVAHFSERIGGVDLELLFEVIRAANFLECEALLKVAASATAKLLGEVNRDPELLASVLGVVQSDDATAFLPWGSDWHASVNEPILEPPADSVLVSPASHVIGDEDALSVCLLACDAPTLCALKGLSPAWCQRSRATLCDSHWQLMQQTLDLEWALGIEVRQSRPPSVPAFHVASILMALSVSLSGWPRAAPQTMGLRAAALPGAAAARDAHAARALC